MDDIISFDKIFQVNQISGLADELKVLYILEKYKKTSVLVITSSLFEATNYYNNIKTYTDDVLIFPMDEFLASVSLSSSPELSIKRLETLNILLNNEKKIVITNLMGLLKFIPVKSRLEESVLNLKIGDSINRNQLISKLVEFGYAKTSIVTSTGEFSIRGFILDIFPYDCENPIRIELFGNIIENIKEFNAESQLSISTHKSLNIIPYKEVHSDNYTNIYKFMNCPLVIKVDPELILQANKQLEQQIFEYNNSINSQNSYMFKYNDLSFEEECCIYTFKNGLVANLDSENIENFHGNYELLKQFVEKNKYKYEIVFYIENNNLSKYIKELFPNYKIVCRKINKGFIINNKIIISENDIQNGFNSIKYKNPVKIGRKIKDFNDIKKGDYVVHSVHGIGVYGGVITLKQNDLEKDYLLINYYGSDKVYISVDKLSSIYKYSDADGIAPKIDKLNSISWQKTKQAVRKRIKDISNELLKLYAERSKVISPKYRNFVEEEIFANEFEFTPTKDQLICNMDIINDLKSDKPMDRLLCGDVGFGKTEVAFRAIFNTILNGYQVAYLCPTTILSKQQYESALKRFKSFPINIRNVNRFTTQKAFVDTCDKLRDGKVDLLFGTHKLLNSNIEFKNLGLLVIDEEQRFGVSHKEKIKQLKTNVNILTLSATPIPRTLKMAMSGLKDLSVLDTAPQNRYPVQTYVVKKNDVVIKDAIYKELSRHGQIFYLFNSVEHIEEEASRIRRLVPEARVCFAHGQMNKIELEKIIDDFIDYEFDILVCTTIIETGIDIPNVNTLIISDAQNYGLSQLYQLRGRVGRTDRIAYAYLTYSPDKVLTETAVKRLKSIQEFTELGSGYKIAMRDLSIRGAGDLLGSEQAGFVESVGIDLFTKMLEEEVNRLKGIEIPEEDLSSKSLVNVNTHISEEYVSDESVRIEIHKLINSIKDYDSLISVKNEIIDRFGKLDDNMEIYMYEEWFENLAKSLGINQVVESFNRIEVQLSEEVSNRIDGEKLFLKVYSINPKFSLKYKLKRIIISLPTVGLEKHHIYYLTELLQQIKNDIE